ncbi:MAG: KOW domain-containing RNA-binding protein, partial [Defluviitaleaceae bacterium]|nr:KOW domain-containing RNA-binding protein [Defluviitaleaceae bacterium]
MSTGKVERPNGNNSFLPGRIVFVKKGRDKGRLMIVLAEESENGAAYLRLVDGKIRPLSKPKRKKAMHVQPTNKIVDFASVGPRGLQDADIRKMLG